MRIVAVEVEDLRRLAGRWRVGPFAPGLNVLAAENEAGKSTLLAAIQAAIFLPYRGAADALRPLGGGVPAVRVELADSAGRWVIAKRFGGRAGRAEVATPAGQTLTGDAAEEEIRRLFGVAPEPRRREVPRGVWGALWVEQGHSFDLSGLDDPARRTLRSALEAEVGTVTGAAGIARLRRVIAGELASLQSPAGRQAAGRLRTARDRRDELEHDLAELRQRRRDVEADLVRLAELREQRAQRLEARREEAFQRRLDQARAKLAELDAEAPWAAAAAQHERNRADALAAAAARLAAARDAERQARQAHPTPVAATFAGSVALALLAAALAIAAGHLPGLSAPQQGAMAAAAALALAGAGVVLGRALRRRAARRRALAAVADELRAARAAADALAPGTALDTEAAAAEQEARRAEAAALAVPTQQEREAIELEIRRCEAERNTARTEDRRIADELSRLEGRLEQIEAEGLDEQIAAAEGERDRLGREIELLEARRAALNLLDETLRQAEEEATASWLEPVVQTLAPWLDRLIPGARATLDEATLQPAGLSRSGREETFAILSRGTQEQIAVLVRLAFAKILHRQGRPAPVILDDALVFSDDARIERMFEILGAASERMQIVLLTCRTGLFSRLGGQKLALERVT
jgi:uncharacterized protein YhaN